MRLTSGRYPWIGGIVILGLAGAIALNFFGIFKWPALHFFNTGTTAHTPDAWLLERTQLLEKVSQLQGLADENARLRVALDFFSKKKFNYTMANIISRDPLSSSLVYLDAGSDDGIAVGQPVIVGNGSMIGKILKVTRKDATLELLSDDSSRIAVKAFDDVSTSGVLRGTLGTGARLEYIREVQAVPVGTILVTSGLEPLIPQGLLVGTIQKVIESADTLFAYADVLPAADMSQLSVVSILRSL
jgi:rod shape-determining protein MreC